MNLQSITSQFALTKVLLVGSADLILRFAANRRQVGDVAYFCKLFVALGPRLFRFEIRIAHLAVSHIDLIQNLLLNKRARSDVEAEELAQAQHFLQLAVGVKADQRIVLAEGQLLHDQVQRVRQRELEVSVLLLPQARQEQRNGSQKHVDVSALDYPPEVISEEEVAEGAVLVAHLKKELFVIDDHDLEGGEEGLRGEDKDVGPRVEALQGNADFEVVLVLLVDLHVHGADEELQDVEVGDDAGDHLAVPLHQRYPVYPLRVHLEYYLAQPRTHRLLWKHRLTLRLHVAPQAHSLCPRPKSLVFGLAEQPLAALAEVIPEQGEEEGNVVPGREHPEGVDEVGVVDDGLGEAIELEYAGGLEERKVLVEEGDAGVGGQTVVGLVLKQEVRDGLLEVLMLLQLHKLPSSLYLHMISRSSQLAQSPQVPPHLLAAQVAAHVRPQKELFQARKSARPYTEQPPPSPWLTLAVLLRLNLSAFPLFLGRPGLPGLLRLPCLSVLPSISVLSALSQLARHPRIPLPVVLVLAVLLQLFALGRVSCARLALLLLSSGRPLFVPLLLSGNLDQGQALQLLVGGLGRGVLPQDGKRESRGLGCQECLRTISLIKVDNSGETVL